MPTLNTESLSRTLRERAIDTERRRLLISRIQGSAQEPDLSRSTNCGGYGRVHTFRNDQPDPWPWNPLPMEPAGRRLGLPARDLTTAQVFQNAACNWRCWYCYVPYNLLAAKEHNAGWLSAQELIDLYLAEPERSRIIDCSGGQPDLTPEWIPWMMEACLRTGIADDVYLWSDDNLSNDYFWRYLSKGERRTIAEYGNYGRAGCFKGFDRNSFHFNTRADPALFDRQFSLFAGMLELGIDLYGYVTLTSDRSDSVDRSVGTFVDRLQDLHENLPLRIVPLRIKTYGAARSRIREPQRYALGVQEQAILAWNGELDRRFSAEQRSMPMTSVPLGH